MWNPVVSAVVSPMSAEAEEMFGVKSGQTIHIVGFAFASTAYAMVAVFVDDYGYFHSIPMHLVRAEAHIEVPA